MNENNTIKELEAQARNTRYLVDKIVKAAYGVTVEEVIRALMEKGGRNHE